MEEPVQSQADWRSDASNHEKAMRRSMAEIVTELVEKIGAPTVALIAGVQETRAVQQWMGSREPQRGDVLRFALQLALMIEHRADVETVRRWFLGSNPMLGGASPAYMLRDRPLNEIQIEILRAARVFAHGDST